MLASVNIIITAPGIIQKKYHDVLSIFKLRTQSSFQVLAILTSCIFLKRKGLILLNIVLIEWIYDPVS